MSLHIPHLIERKRDGGTLTPDEIRKIIRLYMADELPDYQMSALAMTIYFSGLTEEETSALTEAMRDSGRVFRYPADSPPKVDKHSTGGVGDKVSLILAPLLACDGLWVPMICGRGLGITGGTLDKLESIPGVSTQIPEKNALQQLERIGVIIGGQTEEFCPADKRLYALRDVTGTVPSRPLITASILSKKLAESLDRLVFDVKFGSGAFMQTRAEAETLAEGLAHISRSHGVQTQYLLTPMDEPLGKTVGNALEVREAVETLRGGGPQDLVDLTLDLAIQVSNSPREQLAKWLQDGTAYAKFSALVEAQGGDPSDLEDLDALSPAPVVAAIPAPRSGTLTVLDAGKLGRACVLLGGGRRIPSDTIDPRVGLSAIAKTGVPIEQGAPVLMVHAASAQDVEKVRSLLESAIEIPA